MKTQNSLKTILNKALSRYEQFHASTKIKKQKRQLEYSKWPKSWKTVYFKSYPRLDEIVLPKPDLKSTISLKEVLFKRKSSRGFSKEPLSMAKLSTLLFYSAGMKNSSPPLIGRFYPSAGARYPLEVYIIALNTDIPKGVYHYYVKNHSLEELIILKKFQYKDYFIQKDLARSGCIILITGVFKRTTVKYGDRGYRHILQEAGHLAQNLYLLSSALNLSCCATGGYIDSKLEELLDIDGVDESVIYAIAVGNSQQ